VERIRGRCLGKIFDKIAIVLSIEAIKIKMSKNKREVRHGRRT
jgi:hypothetical protein